LSVAISSDWGTRPGSTYGDVNKVSDPAKLCLRLADAKFCKVCPRHKEEERNMGVEI